MPGSLRSLALLRSLATRTSGLWRVSSSTRASHPVHLLLVPGLCALLLAPPPLVVPVVFTWRLWSHGARHWSSRTVTRVSAYEGRRARSIYVDDQLQTRRYRRYPRHLARVVCRAASLLLLSCG